jgi:hypothetical protein
MTKRPTVDPAVIFAVSLVLSAVVWFPTLRGTLHGSVDITDAGIRFFFVLALSWAGVFGISTIVAMYAGRHRRPPPPPGERPARTRAQARQAENEPHASNAA